MEFRFLLLPLLICATGGLFACGSNPRTPYADATLDAKIRPIFLAATQPAIWPVRQSRTGRGRQMVFQRVDVSVPSFHRPGAIEWPGLHVDPARHFAVTQTAIFQSASDFSDAIAAAPAHGSEVTVLYVHGYNQTRVKSVFRLAQIMTDYEEDGPAVAFNWPSAGNPRAYLFDRDSVLFARDDLVALLRELTASSERDIAIIAHSLGAHLVMEALRQIALRDDRQLLARVVWVTLVSPDIDPDVFRRQAETIVDLPREFHILVARQDQALRLSTFLTGGRRRVGLIDGPEDVAGLDVTVIDVSELADGRRGDHGVGFRSPRAIVALGALLDIDAPQDNAPEFLVLGAATN